MNRRSLFKGLLGLPLLPMAAKAVVAAESKPATVTVANVAGSYRIDNTTSRTITVVVGAGGSGLGGAGGTGYCGGGGGAGDGYGYVHSPWIRFT